MELFQSQSSCNGSWYSFAICIKLHNYHTTTLMDIVYICGYVLPPKKVNFVQFEAIFCATVNQVPRIYL